jgi:hypothetical protein
MFLDWSLLNTVCADINVRLKGLSQRTGELYHSMAISGILHLLGLPNIPLPHLQGVQSFIIFNHSSKHDQFT